MQGSVLVRIRSPTHGLTVRYDELLAAVVGRSVSMMMVCAAMCLLHAVGVKLSVVRCSFAIAVLSFRPTYIVYVVGVVVVCSTSILYHHSLKILFA